MKFKTTIRLCAGLLTAGALGAAPALAQEVVKIGYTGPLSGGAAQYGKNVLSGMEMAVKEVNDAGGFDVAGKKYKLELVALDDKYNPSEAATNTQRLVQQHKTPAVLTPHSGGIFAMQAINEQLKVLVLGYSSVPQITARGNKLTLRIPPEYTVYIKPFIEQTMAKFGKNVAIASADHDYGKAWVAAFKPAWEAAGGKVVAENLMSYNRATDFYSGVSRVLAAKPDLMFIGGASEPTGLVIKQARELGFKLGLDANQLKQFTAIFMGLGKMFVTHDLSLLEINPLVITTEGNLLCLDGKINIDSNALYRQPKLRAMHDVSQEDEREAHAAEWDLNYVALDGNIGCMVNGAGLAMAPWTSSSTMAVSRPTSSM